MRVSRWTIAFAATLALGFGAATSSARADEVLTGDPGPTYYPVGGYSSYFNYDWSYGGSQQDWGIPGVDAGTTPYLGSSPAYGLTLTFTGEAPISASSIAIGNGAACAGSTGGGTTFCTISPTDIWEAFLVGPDTIEFLAQNSAYYLLPGQYFFVNVFFNQTGYGPDPASVTMTFDPTFSPTPTPVPAALPLLASGLAGLGLLGWRRNKKQKAKLAAA
jgi:hypothetical protein